MLHSTNQTDQTALALTEPTGKVACREATNDVQLIRLWLHGRSEDTQRAYKFDSSRFFQFAGKGIRQVTLHDLQRFADALGELELRPASRHRILSAVKSLFAYAHRLGYLQLNVARPLRLPQVRDTLNERILDEGQVHRLLALEPNPRNRTMLLLMYAAGIRVSELCGLKWKDLVGRDGSGQITVFGKRGKTRTILLPSSVWSSLSALRNKAADTSPVFKSRKSGHLHRSQVLRIVQRAAMRAEIDRPISPHWLRHAHASHALDRGAAIHLVQNTLGHASVATTGRYLHARPTESSSSYLGL